MFQPRQLHLYPLYVLAFDRSIWNTNAIFLYIFHTPMAKLRLSFTLYRFPTMTIKRWRFSTSLSRDRRRAASGWTWPRWPEFPIRFWWWRQSWRRSSKKSCRREIGSSLDSRSARIVSCFFLSVSVFLAVLFSLVSLPYHCLGLCVSSSP